MNDNTYIDSVKTCTMYTNQTTGQLFVLFDYCEKLI